MTEAGPALLELARSYGVMTSYEERTGGPVRHATTEALVAVLAALGAPIEKPPDASEAVRARTSEASQALLDPVSVIWSDEPEARAPGRAVPLRAASADITEGLDCRLILEYGEVREWRERRRTGEPPSLSIPGPLPHGYHHLTVRVRSREAATHIVCAPERTWAPHGVELRATNGTTRSDARAAVDSARRDFGVFLPLYALRTARSWGTGDLTDLAALLRWSEGRRARFVGTLPLTATYLGGGRAPVDFGPYVPVSRLFWNELYLDVESAPGLEDAPEAQRLLGSPGFRAELGALREGRRVRYAESMAVKRRVLEALAEAIAPGDAPLAGPLGEFAGRRSESAAYARFRAAVERLGHRWREWPDEAGLQDADEAAFRYHLYAQWAMELQVSVFGGASRHHSGAGHTGSERPSGRDRDEPSLDGPPVLYLDLPLGTHPDGFDVWRFRRDFATGLSGGAPPDPFQEEGQDWGFPPLHPERTREDGHAYLRGCLRHLMRASGMLRLDHVMSLHRLYCIPTGHAPLDGAYVRYPAEELYAMLCVESHRWHCEVVGEDLGTVPPEVRESMSRRGLRRMYVLPFELEAPGTTPPPGPSAAPPVPPPRLVPVPPLSIASLGTHDLPTFAAFTTGLDIDRKLEERMITAEAAERQHTERARWFAALKDVVGAKPDATPGEVLPRALRLLAASPAEHVLVNVEDLWGETESQNAPGTVSDENWTLRAAYPLEEWSGLPGVEQLFSSLVRERETKPPRRTARASSPRRERQRARGEEWPK